MPERNFLSFAKDNWATPPRYVLLAGEGTYDYKAHQGGADNIIPARLVPTPDGLYAWDGWYADFDDDLLPELAFAGDMNGDLWMRSRA